MSTEMGENIQLISQSMHLTLRDLRNQQQLSNGLKAVLLCSKRGRTRLSARSHSLNPAHTASSAPPLPRKGKYYQQHQKKIKNQKMLYFTESHHSLLLDIKNKPKQQTQQE